MLERLEGDEGVLWSVHSPNIYDALSAMYAPRDTVDVPSSTNCSPRSCSVSPTTASATATATATATASESLLTDKPSATHHANEGGQLSPSYPYTTIPDIDSEKELRRRTFFDFFCCLSVMFGVLVRQCYHILRMRLAEVRTNFTQFVYTQILLPFLVVLGVVVGCRDVSYPKVELSSRNTDGIGEVCVGVGPGSASTRQQTPLSSPYDKITADQAINDTFSHNFDNSHIEDNPVSIGDITEDNHNSEYDNSLHSESISGMRNEFRLMRILLRIYHQIKYYFFPKPVHQSDNPDESQNDGYGNENERSSLYSNSSEDHQEYSRYFHYGKNQTLNDYRAGKEYSGYGRLLTLLGE